MSILGVHEDDTHISGEKRTVYFPNQVRQFPTPEYGWAMIALILQPEFLHGNLLKLLSSSAVDLAFTLWHVSANVLVTDFCSGEAILDYRV